VRAHEIAVGLANFSDDTVGAAVPMLFIERGDVFADDFLDDQADFSFSASLMGAESAACADMPGKIAHKKIAQTRANHPVRFIAHPSKKIVTKYRHDERKLQVARTRRAFDATPLFQQSRGDSHGCMTRPIEPSHEARTHQETAMTATQPSLKSGLAACTSLILAVSFGAMRDASALTMALDFPRQHRCLRQKTVRSMPRL